MQTKRIYDLIGIGIGPFNLGLAALCHDLPQLQCLFIDQQDNFNWHPGLLLPTAKLQVPFYADLVTLADPCSRFSYLNFLKQKKRMFRFAILEDYYIKRTSYNEYSRWVADQLDSLLFNCHCDQVHYNEVQQVYTIETNLGKFYAKKIVIGIGSVPHVPSFAKEVTHPCLLHSADYLFKKEMLLQRSSITIVGSGQSAGEIFYDLLQCYEGTLHWFTRSSRFFPMDYSKLTLEMSTPEYIDHFYSLPEEARDTVLKDQDSLYKGINASLIDAIYATLDEKQSDNIKLHTNCELTGIGDEFMLHLYHRELQRSFTHHCDAVIFATGYAVVQPKFLAPMRNYLLKTPNRNYSINEDDSIFVQNAEQRSHGFNTSDLSLGAYRNAVILNSILGHEHYSIETGNCFQNFGIPVA